MYPNDGLSTRTLRASPRRMNISFLCGSLEPGKDGVGDYVRQFALHLQSEGHQCQLVALADRFIAQPSRAPLDDCGGEIVRIPQAAWEQGDTEFAEQALLAFRPEWTSLQMVCYAYHPRGLLLQAGESFRRLKGPGRRHLMFHELWVGEAAGERRRNRVLGWLQKRLLLRACRIWAPDVVHTSNGVYRELLARNGLRACELPLPGNIPIVRLDHSDARLRLLQKLGHSAQGGRDLLLAGVFGSIHPKWEDPGMLRALAARCSLSGQRLVLVQLGRAGKEGLQLWQQLATQLGDALDFHSLGECTPHALSMTLSGLDLGIATSPWALVGKSGSVAALREHGVPVVVTRDDYRLRRGPTPLATPTPLLYRFDAAFLDLVSRRGLPRLPAVAEPELYRDFIRDLEGEHRVMDVLRQTA